jgi:hypothetical protein
MRAGVAGLVRDRSRKPGLQPLPPAVYPQAICCALRLLVPLPSDLRASVCSLAPLSKDVPFAHHLTIRVINENWRVPDTEALPFHCSVLSEAELRGVFPRSRKKSCTPPPISEIAGRSTRPGTCCSPARSSCGKRRAATLSASTWTRRSGSQRLVAATLPCSRNCCRRPRRVWSMRCVPARVRPSEV